MLFCTKCGSARYPDASFCSTCGYRFEDLNTTASNMPSATNESETPPPTEISNTRRKEILKIQNHIAHGLASIPVALYFILRASDTFRKYVNGLSITEIYALLVVLILISLLIHIFRHSFFPLLCLFLTLSLVAGSAIGIIFSHQAYSSFNWADWVFSGICIIALLLLRQMINNAKKLSNK
jgi:membrane-associated HD superfamily phosphohydrolase